MHLLNLILFYKNSRSGENEVLTTAAIYTDPKNRLMSSRLGFHSKDHRAYFICVAIFYGFYYWSHWDNRQELLWEADYLQVTSGEQMSGAWRWSSWWRI